MSYKSNIQVTSVAFTSFFTPHIFIIAIPIIADSLNISIRITSLSIPIFFLGSIFGLSIISPLSHTYGALRVMKIAMPVFVAGSLIAVLIHSLIAFFITVFILGIIITSVSAAAKTLLNQDNTSLKKLTTLIAAIAIIAYIAPAIAMITGSLIVIAFGWQTVFMINAIIGSLITVFLFFSGKVKNINKSATFFTNIKHIYSNYFLMMQQAKILPFAVANAMFNAALFIFVSSGFYTLHLYMHVSLKLLDLGMIAVSLGAILGNLLVFFLIMFLHTRWIMLFALLITLIASIFLIVFANIMPSYWSFFIPFSFYMTGVTAISSLSKSIFMKRFDKIAPIAISFNMLMQTFGWFCGGIAGAHLLFSTAWHFSVILLALAIIGSILLLFDIFIIAPRIKL